MILRNGIWRALPNAAPMPCSGVTGKRDVVGADWPNPACNRHTVADRSVEIRGSERR